MKRPFASKRGHVEVRLGAHERAVLEQLPALLDGVGFDEDDPAAARMDPAAYPDDAAAEAEFKRLSSEELTSARHHDRDLFLESLRSGSQRIETEEAEAWMRVIGDARLAVAARNGVVRDEMSWEDKAETDPELGFVAWLGYLQGTLVEAVMDTGELG